MSDHKENPLLDAIDDLTKPVRSKVMQGERLVTVEQPPPLLQLDAAIRSTIGGASTPGASLAFEGAVLNTAALFTAMRISNEINDWCRALQIRPGRDTGANLRGWYVKFTQGHVDVGVERQRTKKLTGFGVQIWQLLDPPRERELPDPCPVCQASAWFDPKDGQKYNRPLIVKYRPDVEDMIAQARGLCRACAATWSARELAFALEMRDATRGDESAEPDATTAIS